MNPDPGTLANIDFMLLGAAKSSDVHAAAVPSAMCQTESQNVTTAATLVSNTCSPGPPTMACTSAIKAFDEAVTAFRDCLRNFQSEK